MNWLVKLITKRRERRLFLRSSPREIFTYIYHSNKWGDRESISGTGSNLNSTRTIREQLPALLRRIGARSMLDIPCGDYHWMSHCELDLDLYIGADIVAELVETNARQFSNATHQFRRLDLMRDPLPEADVLLCRDCLVHLSFRDAAKAVNNIRLSRCRYLLATTFMNLPGNQDKITGKHRPLNLEKAPFGWPKPMEFILEDEAGSKYEALGKGLALWRVSDLTSLSSVAAGSG